MDVLKHLEQILESARSGKYSRVVPELEALKGDIQNLVDRIALLEGSNQLPPGWKLHLNRYRSDELDQDFCAACFQKDKKVHTLMVVNEDYFECPVCKVSVPKDPYHRGGDMVIPDEEFE